MSFDTVLVKSNPWSNNSEKPQEVKWIIEEVLVGRNDRESVDNIIAFVGELVQLLTSKGVLNFEEFKTLLKHSEFEKSLQEVT